MSKLLNTDDGIDAGQSFGSVSVIVCTRDRPESLKPALESILRSSYADFELIVVDQSTEDATEALVQGIKQTDDRLVYARDRGKGLSRSRNIGLSLAKHEFAVFTDDDCEPKRDWLHLMVRALGEDPCAGLIYGTVTPAPCDPAEGFIVGFLPKRRRRLTGRWGKLLDSGIGASMGFRSEVFERIGYFDEMLGAGAYLSSAEDCDIAYRVLAGGYALLHLPEADVTHYGLRDWQSGSALISKTFEAVSATYMKPLRRGDAIALLLVLQQLGLALSNLGESLLKRRKPFGFRRVLAVLRGVHTSFELDVQADPLVYVRRNRPAVSQPAVRSEG